MVPKGTLESERILFMFSYVPEALFHIPAALQAKTVHHPFIAEFSV